MSSQDTEITLGTGKMIALFFGLVALNGAFFGMGYSLGRAGTRPTLAGVDQPQSASAVALRPSAMKSGSGASQGSDNLTFYKAVEQKDPAQPTASEQTPPAAKDAPAPAAADPKASDAAPDAAAVLSSASYFVQVAAVSKQDDAQALVDALKKKQYAAFTANTSPTDKLFHVQVGPFTDVKDAEATKAKLVSDGYNPILKK